MEINKLGIMRIRCLTVRDKKMQLYKLRKPKMKPMELGYMNWWTGGNSRQLDKQVQT